MAHFWAMEEARGPRSWDDDQELDYSEIAKKRGDGEELSESKDSGMYTLTSDDFFVLVSQAVHLKNSRHVSV